MDQLETANEAAVMFADQETALKDRKLFVHNLGVLLSQTRESVAGCALDDHEYVHIQFKNGYERKVCVECDSYIAIARDVCREI